MNLRALVLTLGILSAADGAAVAQSFPEGVYVGIRAIGSFAELDDVNPNGFGGTLNIQNDTDTVAGLGGVVGYRWQGIPLRTEIEAGYRFRFDLDAQDVGAPTIDYEADVATTTVLFNALLEWRNESDFTPFVGGSVGWARHSSDTKRVNTGTSAKVSKETDEDNLAWGGMAGIDWHFAEQWSAEFAYRYVNLGDVDAGSFSGGDGVNADDYTSHDIMLSVNFRF